MALNGLMARRLRIEVIAANDGPTQPPSQSGAFPAIVERLDCPSERAQRPPFPSRYPGDGRLTALALNSPGVPRMKLRHILAGPLAIAFAISPSLLPAQGKITSPKEFFGHDIGADYELPNYTKL